ncbi:Hypothetical_protein [Hexamita inflata]|uniref:Hypothetical_protein n=1 Tax=Hexamita inflata TaxID=28002 RepID=A0AA86UPU0_9EUKA|nr:Hypothetical protein HINF_LOCUS47386 [Hexamita inflata]
MPNSKESLNQVCFSCNFSANLIINYPHIRSLTIICDSTQYSLIYRKSNQHTVCINVAKLIKSNFSCVQICLIICMQTHLTAINKIQLVNSTDLRLFVSCQLLQAIAFALLCIRARSASLQKCSYMSQQFTVVVVQFIANTWTC